MEENLQSDSYLLGKFVGMVQGMEDAVPGAEQKGDHWGEHLLPLFTANMESSLHLASKIVGNLPRSLEVSGKVLSVEDITRLLSSIDIEALKSNIVEEEYISGYRNWKMSDTEETAETVKASVNCTEENSELITENTMNLEMNVAYSTNPSYNLGVFLANLQCMEECIAEAGGDVSASRIENILLLIEMSFDSSMQIVDKILSTLPETTVFKGKEVSILQLKKARALLDVEGMSKTSLDVSEFKRGYEVQHSQYLT